MFTKGEKTKAGWVIKDAIQQLLLTTPLRFNEIMLHFDVEPSSMKNYIASLKVQKLIKHHPDDMTKHISFRRYIAIPDMPIFSNIIKESLALRKLGAFKSREKRNEIYLDAKSKDYVTLVTADDYHTKGSQEKRCAWIGSTFGTMEY